MKEIDVSEYMEDINNSMKFIYDVFQLKYTIGNVINNFITL